MSETPVKVSHDASLATSRTNAPSALLFECMAHINMSLEQVCETSPRMWKRLNCMFGTTGGVRRLHSNRPAACRRRVGVQSEVLALCAGAIGGLSNENTRCYRSRGRYRMR